MTKRPVTRALLAAFCMVVCSTAGMRTAVAQGGGTFSGTVSTVGHKPVANARVSIDGPSGRYSEQTDARGFFSITGVREDAYTAAVSANGFGSAVNHVTINNGRTTVLNVTLAPALRQIGR